MKVSTLLVVQVAVIFFSFQFISLEITSPVNSESDPKSPSFIPQGISQANTSDFSKIEHFADMDFKKYPDPQNLFLMFLLLNLASFAGVAFALIRSMQTETKQKIKTEKLSVIGELAARLSHDLRNPLSVIKNANELLKLQLDDSDNKIVQNSMASIERSVYRMSHQVDDVLNYVRPMFLKKALYSLCTIIQDSVDRLDLHNEITINLPKDDCQILCDNIKLEIVLVNVLTNAIQTFEGKTGTITISFDDSNKDFTIIEINDDGPGIDSKTLSQLFDPLFTTKQLGTGLGLPSCKSIIENHGGKIAISSTQDTGTTVKIQIPKNS